MPYLFFLNNLAFGEVIWGRLPGLLTKRKMPTHREALDSRFFQFLGSKKRLYKRLRRLVRWLVRWLVRPHDAITWKTGYVAIASRLGIRWSPCYWISLVWKCPNFVSLQIRQSSLWMIDDLLSEIRAACELDPIRWTETLLILRQKFVTQNLFNV
jgi:hypothetical protein